MLVQKFGMRSILALLGGALLLGGCAMTAGGPAWSAGEGAASSSASPPEPGGPSGSAPRLGLDPGTYLEETPQAP